MSHGIQDGLNVTLQKDCCIVVAKSVFGNGFHQGWCHDPSFGVLFFKVGIWKLNQDPFQGSTVLTVSLEDPVQVDIGVASNKVKSSRQLPSADALLGVLDDTGSNLESQVIALVVGMGRGHLAEKPPLATTNVHH